MDKFRAKLTGESDGHTISREFRDMPSAKAWLEGIGWASFDDQSARGEIWSDDGRIIWTKSHLQTRERTEKDRALEGHRFLTRLGITDKGRR